VKYTILLTLLFLSVNTFACKCVPGDIDKWFSESLEVAHIRVVTTVHETNPEIDKERVQIKYEVIESFKGKVKGSGIAYEGLHNCALGVRAGEKYIFYIRESRIISRCGGSQMIYDWTDKGKQILDQLRSKALNKSTHSNSLNVAGV
jgi:predicted transcriptional regulator